MRVFFFLAGRHIFADVINQYLFVTKKTPGSEYIKGILKRAIGRIVNIPMLISLVKYRCNLNGPQFNVGLPNNLLKYVLRQLIHIKKNPDLADGAGRFFFLAGPTADELLKLGESYYKHDRDVGEAWKEWRLMNLANVFSKKKFR